MKKLIMQSDNDYIICTKTFDIKHFCNNLIDEYPACSIKDVRIKKRKIEKCLNNRFKDAPIGDYAWFQADGIFAKPFFFVKIIKKGSDEFICEYYLYATDDMDDAHELDYS